MLFQVLFMDKHTCLFFYGSKRSFIVAKVPNLT